MKTIDLNIAMQGNKWLMRKILTVWFHRNQSAMCKDCQLCSFLNDKV